MNEARDTAATRVPTVYFIDDSATMREVIKIAFRKENIHVITCPDAASALSQFSGTAPDAVITDVIMPDRDGYEVCQFIKQNEQLKRTPVILMSGVVNRTVAEKAMAVKADELMRKPFQPHDLILRVKNLLDPKSAVPSPSATPESSRALSTLFSPGSSAAPAPVHAPAPARSDVRSLPFQSTAAAVQTPAPPAVPLQVPPLLAPAPANAASSAEAQKLRNEIQRLQLLVKKLQAQVDAERQYSASLEAHCKTLQGSE